MKRLSLLGIQIFFLFNAYSQVYNHRIDSPNVNLNKPVIDSTVYKKWTHVAGAKLSNDGKYMCYNISAMKRGGASTVIKECEGNWEIRIPEAVNVQFVCDSKIALFRRGDTLNVLKLGSDILTKILKVRFEKISDKGSGELIAFTDSTGKLVVGNFQTGEFKSYKSAQKYSFSEDRKFLILERSQKEKDELIQSVCLLNISSGEFIPIWKGKGLVKLLVNQFATKFAFLIANEKNDSRSIWYREIEKSQLDIIVNDSLIRIQYNAKIDDISEINDKYGILSFTAKKIQNLPDTSGKSFVTIWSYQDPKLPTEKIIDDQFVPIYTFIFDIKHDKVVQVTRDNEWVLGKSNDGLRYLIEASLDDSSPGDRTWSSTAKRFYLLRAFDMGVSTDKRFNGLDVVEISPSGRFVILFDMKSNDYFCYDVLSNIYRNVTNGLSVSWINYYREDLFQSPRGVAGWLDNDEAVLIYDRFDIWKVDPLDKKKPVNLTNGYGLNHSIIFSLALSNFSNSTFSSHETVVLNALNIKSKENGFFQKEIGTKGDPLKLIMGNYIYHLIGNPYVENIGEFPIKARDSKKFIVSRMSANESPNYFFTKDFGTFTQLSFVYPEKKYNWYTTELHSWRKCDGTLLQGILYKPDNFDSSRRYPVIFYYYEKKSFGLNAYIVPEDISVNCNLNIPTFVSNGFLVFSPDIDYKIGDPMQGTYDAVVSSAEYVSKFSFVDSKRMGIGGCSFGGWQTNYLVAHTDLFAAAYSSSSLSDLISAYGDVPGRYTTLSSLFEDGQGRMGATLWQKPEAYIKNSPIFNADKVTTPLLLMHTTNDGICSFSQALELFTALRRLGKKVWLLEYAEGNHGIDGKSANDFGIRLFQFFDHYLRGLPAPVWMTRGLPGSLQKEGKAYLLDYNIITPGKGLVADSIVPMDLKKER